MLLESCTMPILKEILIEYFRILVFSCKGFCLCVCLCVCPQGENDNSIQSLCLYLSIYLWLCLSSYIQFYQIKSNQIKSKQLMTGMQCL